MTFRSPSDTQLPPLLAGGVGLSSVSDSSPVLASPSAREASLSGDSSVAPQPSPTTLPSPSTVFPSAPLSREQLHFSVVAKPTGAACNLDCQYCFFLSKELLYDIPRQQMSEETLQTYVAEFLAASPDGEVTMLWQGGEPTLRGLPFYRRLVELCEQYRRPTQRVVHALQTNGTLIDARWAQFLAENDVLVGVSIDGPERMHDAYRLNRGGRGTHAMVLRGWRHLQAAGVRCNVLCTVHHANEEHGGEVYRYFRDELGARYMQFIPIVERVEEKDVSQAESGWRVGEVPLLYRQAGRCVTSRSVRPEAYGRFLSEVFDEWYRTDVGDVFVQDIDSAVASLFGMNSVCVHAPECGTNMAMEFNGDVYACDHWVEPEWLVGNVARSPFSELASSEVMERFSRKKKDLSAECRACPFLRMCNGGCPKDRFVLLDDGSEQNYLCAGYRRFYSHVRPALVAMGRLIAGGREAREILRPEVRALVGAPEPVAPTPPSADCVVSPLAPDVGRLPLSFALQDVSAERERCCAPHSPPRSCCSSSRAPRLS